MTILSYLIRDALSDTSDCCVLCFNKISEIGTPYNVKDEVSISTDTTLATTEVLYEIIHSVLGDKVLDSISAHDKICQKCTGIAINCYKFIQQCRKNIDQLHSTIDSLEKCTQTITAGNYDYKSLFVVLDTSNYNVELYYDKHQNNNKRTPLLERFERIYVDSQQFNTDMEVESNSSPDNKICAVKKRSRILQSIKLADILHGKDDLNNLICKTCLQLYPTVMKLKQHYLRVHAPKDFKCSQCPRSFGSSLILKQHTKNSHCTVVCSQCGKTYPSLYSLRCHEIRHNRSRLVCQTCGKVYKGKQSFNKHIEKKLCEKMRKSNAEAKLSCDYCGKKYAQKAALSEHIRIEHENGKALICDWCGKKFGCMSRLKDHIVTHTKQKNFECEQCGGKFVTKRSLLYHTRTHTGEKPYKCEQCEKRFVSAGRRSEHMKRHNTQSRLECDICHGKFKGKWLDRHRRKHFDVRSRLYRKPPDSVVELHYDKHQKNNNRTPDMEVDPNCSPDNKKCAVKRRKQCSILQSIELKDILHDDLNNLKCKTCLELYPTVKKLKQHYLRVHAPKDFKCSQCPRSFGSLLILKQHTKDSHSISVCSQCGKTYPNLNSLRRHESGHNRSGLVCQKCGKVYKGKRSFNNHIEKKLCEKMRKSNAEAKLSCDHCEKKYAQKAALSEHIRLEHENGKALICGWCGKKLGSKSRLNDHIVTHTKQKNFECEQCGGKFVTKTSLLYHTRTHTGEKPYKCEQCEMRFLSLGRRSEHVKRHHTQSTSLECDICHDKFKRSTLTRHRRKHFDARSRLYCNPPDSVVSSTNNVNISV